MRRALIVSLLSTLLPLQHSAPPMVCRADVGYFGNTFQFYDCTTGQIERSSSGDYPATTPVSKTWFKAHCTKKHGHMAYNSTVAVCDAYAVPDGTLTAKTAAAPSKTKQRIEVVALGAVVGVLVVACLASGGCAALGGGL